MGRGGKRDYKPKRGGGKSFSRNLQPLDAEGNETNTPDRWEPRKRNQEVEDDEDDDDDSGSGSESGSGSSESDDSSDDGLGAAGAPKPKKTAGSSAADVANPNRAGAKQIKASELAGNSYEPSRKEREAAEKKAAQERYWKLHQAGKTDEAKSDLARLKIIREKREAAARARAEEKAAATEEARIALERTQGIGKKI